MGLERVPSLPFLLRQVRVGVVATGLTVAALGVSYFGFERAPFHRVGLALVLVIVAAGGACIAALPWARLFETTGMRFLYVWSVADIVLISFAVAATGGGRSDLFLLYTLTTFFFVASYPPIAQLALLIFTAASYTAVMTLTGWQITAGALVARLSILAVLAYLAGYLSKELLDRVQSGELYADARDVRDRHRGRGPVHGWSDPVRPSQQARRGLPNQRPHPEGPRLARRQGPRRHRVGRRGRTRSPARPA